jgi:hypothetical protein
MRRDIHAHSKLAAVALLAGGFTIGTVAQVINLPSPIVLETFNEVQEGSLPTGWTVQNFSDGGTGSMDLDDPKSDAYMDWVVISRDRVQAIGDAGGWDAANRLGIKAGQIVNGVEITNLINGNFIYAESDTRGGNQVQYLFSPDFNCTGKSNVYLSYHSIYEQNQDNIGAVEYSVDGGSTWLPIVYMLDTPDIVKDASGNVDGYATMIAPQGDSAVYTDPTTGEPKGGYYGAFIGVLSNKWSTIGPFISARVNDDTTESKRVELFHLDQADNQAKVRLRFAQAGTGSWYFGVDDVGLYSIQQTLPATISQSPASQSVSAGATITLKVVATGEGLRYQWKFNGNNLLGQTGATLTLPNVKPGDAGDYQVVVSNLGGDVSSPVAKLTVFSGSITQDLVVHLPFDNNLDDSSGKKNNATAMGGSSFSTGKIGQALHVPSGADYVTLGTPTDLNFSTNTDFTIALWAKLTDWGGDPSLIGNKDWNSGGNQGYVLATDGDGHFQWNLAGPPGSRKDYDGTPGLFSDHNWHHVAITVQRAGDIVTYIDGQSVNNQSLAANITDLNTPDGFATNIGQDGTGGYGSAFNDADFDDLGIWRRILTAQEVATIVSQGQTGKDLTTATPQPPAEAPKFSRIAKAADGSLILEWTGGGTLQAASAVTGPWQDVAGATSPYTLKATGTAMFGRIKQ